MDKLKEAALTVLFWFFKKRSELFRFLYISIKKIFALLFQATKSASSQEPGSRATVFLHSDYQKPYLINFEKTIEAMGDVKFCSIDIAGEKQLAKRVFLTAKNHGVGFHACPFRTGRFPGTLSHILVSHGLDGGRYDSLGSFGFGSGRVLGRKSQRLYDFLLVASPWSQELAYREVAEYSGRVLVTGDWRADAIIDAAHAPVENRASLKIKIGNTVVGIASSHGPHSAFRKFGHQLIETLSAFGDDVSFLIFFHEYEAIFQKPLFELVREHCKNNMNCQIVPVKRFEQALVVCDLLISDYGGTSLYYSLLGRPLLFLPFDESFMLEDFPTMTLKQCVKTVPSLLDAIPYIGKACEPKNNILSPPDWFIQRLYPAKSEFSLLSKKALERVFSDIA
ncbi:CDP-glycerol glycerophosphotransferase family protein [Pseudomonadales bacterium]|nr:CDP-glycerol glycerophosphotransferase family protein [Pseudomonadales bacterium]